jgi:GTP-binding protein
MSLLAQLPIVAIVGRPNVGKSTLFNRFAGHRRALALDEPGITRDRIAEEVEVNGRRVLLVDTAGLDPDAQAGLAAAIQAQARSAIEGADAILFLVDGKAGLLPEDAELARLLRRSDKPVTLVVNKIDPAWAAARLIPAA